jgi:hypothetical protein
VSATVSVDRPSNATPRLLAIAALGGAVALTLGIYGNVHDPSKQLVFTLFFSTTISMKVWLASLALVFAIVQVLTALWVYGQISTDVPAWAGTVHRISGRLAFIISLPVAYHCLWSALPIAGGLMFSVLVAVWFTSAYWFIHAAGWPSI